MFIIKIWENEILQKNCICTRCSSVVTKTDFFATVS